MLKMRLCVPISGCSPPAVGLMPSVRWHQSTPPARSAAEYHEVVHAGALCGWWSRSQKHLARHAGHAVAAHPDGVALLLHMHAPRAAQAGALAWPRYCAGARPAPIEPLGQCGVQAAGHGVFGQAVVAGKKARTSNAMPLRIAAAPRRRSLPRGPTTPTSSRSEDGRVWLERQHLRAARQQHGAPAGAVVAPGVLHDASRATPRPRAIRATSASSSGPPRRSGGAANASRSPCWRMVTRPTPHSWHDAARHLRLATRLQPGVAGAQRGVAGKGSSPAG